MLKHLTISFGGLQKVKHRDLEPNHLAEVKNATASSSNDKIRHGAMAAPYLSILFVSLCSRSQKHNLM